MCEYGEGSRKQIAKSKGKNEKEKKKTKTNCRGKKENETGVRLKYKANYIGKEFIQPYGMVYSKQYTM